MSKTETKTRPVSHQRVLDLALIALFAALIAVCAWISIPGPGNISFTLQVFGVLLALGLLGGKRGTLAIAVYILLGAVGLPVFANFGNGFGVLAGVTGGYITGFLLSGLLYWGITSIPAFRGKGTVATLVIKAVAMILGVIVCYAAGTVQFMAVGGNWSVSRALGLCVIPFIPFDAAKLVLALVLTWRLARYVPSRK